MNSKRHIAKTMMIVVGFALGLMIPATAAEAGRKNKDRHKVKRHDQRHEQRYDRHDRHNRRDRHDRRDHRRDARYGHDYRIVDGYRHDARRSHRRAPFRIPERIRVRSRMDYRPYFYGERFHRRHGHMHVVYRFPVYTEYGMEYRAVSYCQGDYYRTGRFVYEGPRYGFSIQF